MSINDSIPLPVKAINLKDRDNLAFFIDGASILRDTVIHGQKKIRVSGDLFFKISTTKLPLYIYTSLMELKVLEPSTFRISAYDSDQGQSVESLKGKIRIAKNYASPFPEPDTLHENNLYMVNKSIDLSEKENLDTDKLAQWWERVKDTKDK